MLQTTLPRFEIARRPVMNALAWMLSVPTAVAVYVKTARPPAEDVAVRVLALGPNT
jgi:hypothetical protein